MLRDGMFVCSLIVSKLNKLRKFQATHQINLGETTSPIPFTPWLLKFLYRNTLKRGLTLSKQSEISHKKMCDSSIRVEKASKHTLNA